MNKIIFILEKKNYSSKNCLLMLIANFSNKKKYFHYSKEQRKILNFN